MIYPDFDLMAAITFPNHVGPFLVRDCGRFVPWEAPTAFTSAIRSSAATCSPADQIRPRHRPAVGVEPTSPTGTLAHGDPVVRG